MQPFQVAQGLGHGMLGTLGVGWGEEAQRAAVPFPRPQVVVAVRLGR